VLLNACQAGEVPSFVRSGGIAGLVEALLVAGSYVVAARWPVTDPAARAFAAAFYAALVEAGEPLGAAVRRGREACRGVSAEDDLTWAAYVLYGDPKLAVSRSAEE
jgi:CHAT domain-containing protein